VIQLTSAPRVASHVQHQDDVHSRITVMTHPYFPQKIEDETAQQKVAAVVMELSGLVFWTALIVMPIVAEISALTIK
jgi:hypothetical protein